MSEKVEVGIDEMTIIVMISKSFVIDQDWSKVAKSMVSQIDVRLSLEKVFGEGHWTEKKMPSGYTVGRAFENLEGNFCIAFNSDRWDMGVVIKFSARALAEYKERYLKEYGFEILENEIIQNLDSLGHVVRLSRIDLTADYINAGIKVSTIYNQLKRGNQIIRYASGRKNSSSLSGYEYEKKADTIYVGKRVKNGNGLMRLYDKKKEQIENYGFRYKEAVDCDSWVRCEAEFHNKYAHDLTDALRMIQTKEELGNLIATAIVDRYSFYHVKSEKPTKITKLLIEMIESQDFVFSSPSSRNNDLEKSFRYLIWYSGLISFLYKIKAIWGEEGLAQVYEVIDHEVHAFEPTKDVSLWLQKYADDYEAMDMDELPFFERMK